MYSALNKCPLCNGELQVCQNAITRCPVTENGDVLYSKREVDELDNLWLECMSCHAYSEEDYELNEMLDIINGDAVIK